MTIERTITGWLVIEERQADGTLFKRKYQGYTLKEAKAEFKLDLQEWRQLT